MNRTPRLQQLLLMVILLAAWTLRLYRLDFQDIWWDEARNIDVAGRPLAQIASAPELDIHPPAYFYLLHGWMGLAGRSAFAVRFLSLWFSELLVPLIYTLGRHVAGWWAGLGAALGAAFLPFLVGEAQEARMYTVVLVWLTAAGLAVLRATEQRGGEKKEPESRKQKAFGAPFWPWLMFALFSALALLTHYAAAFALAALWTWAAGWVILCRRPGLKARLASLALAGFVALALYLPALPIALRQIPSYRNPNLIVPAVGSYLAELARAYSLGEHIDGAVAQPWIWVLVALLLGGWLSTVTNRAVIYNAQNSGRHCLVFAILWAFLPLLIYYLVIRDRATFASRYISVALPGWLLLAGLAVRGWARAGRPWGTVAGLALVLTLTPGLHGDLADVRFFREDTRGLVAWLKAETTPDDLILVDQRYPFGFYYERWNNDPNGFPPPAPTDLAPAQYLFVDINTVAERLTVLAQGHRRIYWVRWFESDTDPRGAVSFLLEKFGTRLGEQAFRGYVVTWYLVAEEGSPSPHFELAPTMSALEADFGSQVRLVEAAFGGRGAGGTSTAEETRRPQAPADRPIWVVLRWAKLPAAAGRLKATLVLTDPHGLIVGRDDRLILNDRHLAPDQWAADERPLGAYLVYPYPATPPGIYTLKLAVYEPDTLSQLPVHGKTAQGNFVTLGQIQLTRATRPPTQLPLVATADLTWRGVRLLGRGPLPAELSPGDTLELDLYWDVPGPGRESQADLHVRLALADASGQERDRHEAVPVAGHYTTSRWQTGEVVWDHQRWQLDPGLPAGVYRLLVALADPADGQQSPAFALGEISVAGRPHTFELMTTPAFHADVRIGDFARLLGFDLSSPTPRRGSELRVTLYWQANGASAIPYTVFVQLLDAQGRLRSQRDQYPGAGRYPTTGWVPGEFLTDTYHLALPADLPTGDYTLVVGMYDLQTMARLSVTAADGRPLGDFWTLTTVQVTG